jgi:hypothetical protein
VKGHGSHDGQQHAAQFQRNLMASSLPKLPVRYSSPTTNEPMGLPGVGGPINAWGAPEDSRHVGSPAKSSRGGGNNNSNNYGKSNGNNFSASGSLMLQQHGQSQSQSQMFSSVGGAAGGGGGTGALIDVPDETTISVGLMRIADKLARLVLPWQAVLCPRAVETLFDLRKSIIQTRHVHFIEQMKLKLQEKVMGFIKKKEEEVEIWLENEIKSWSGFMDQGESDLTEYIKNDLSRMSDRAAAQDAAYLYRELAIATALDDHERDSTREQLISFRRICRAQHPGTSPNEQTAMEVKLLQDSIAKAQSVINKKMATTRRKVVK